MKKLLLAIFLFCGGLQAADCSRNVTTTSTSSGNIVVVAAGGQQIRVCAVYFSVLQGATAANFKLMAGTSTACSANQEDITVTWQGVATALQEEAQEVPSNALLVASAGKDLCLNLSAAPSIAAVQVIYELF